jgi:hypothetical protein
VSLASFRTALSGFQARTVARPSANPAYLEALQARCWNASWAELETEPYSAERMHLQRRSTRLSNLRRAVDARLREVGA